MEALDHLLAEFFAPTTQPDRKKTIGKHSSWPHTLTHLDVVPVNATFLLSLLSPYDLQADHET